MDLTDGAQAGETELEIRVVNLWPNRLIGGEELPEDCQWRGAAQSGGQPLLEGEPSPTGRATITTWKHWAEDSPLWESGLLGPVTLRMVGSITLELLCRPDHS